MKDHKVFDKTRKLCNRIKARLKAFSKRASENRAGEQVDKHKLVFEQSQSIAYHFIGDKTELFLPLFKGLDLDLQKSGVKIGFKAYVSLTILTTALVSLAMPVLIPCLLFIVFRMPLMPAFLFGVGGCLFTFAFSIIGFYAYPIYRADKLRRGLEDELPFTTGYMAILTSAGVSPERIFYSLSNLSAPLAISTEARNVVRSVNLFGLDIISALSEASRRAPSERFREMLEGFISTIHSGGSSTAYLQEKSRQYMKLKRISLRKFSDTLSVLSEFYVALLLTGPLLLVIMLAVMTMLGGGNMGLLSPDLLLNLLTYLGLPVGATIFLIILDAVTPKW